MPPDAVTLTRTDDSLDVAAPGLRLTDLIRGSVDPRDARTHPDALRAYIEASTGLQLPDPHPASSPDRSVPLGTHPDVLHDLVAADPGPADEVPPTETGTMLHASAAGDLSGDGKDDVLILELALPEDVVTLRAVRGTNASELWRLDLDAFDAVPYPVDDMTGDGIDDLLVWEFRLEDESEVEDCPDDLNCHYEYDATYEWVVGLRSGATGKRLWSTAYAGEDHYRYVHETEETVPGVSTTESYEEAYDSPNFLVVPNVSGDHDGDGRDDLVLQELDVDFLAESSVRTTADVVEESAGASHLHTATRATVTRGANGAKLLARTSPMGPGVSRLIPVGNLTGTLAPDLLWQEEISADSAYSCVSLAEEVEDCTDDPETDYSLDLQLLDGATLNTAWQTEFEDVQDGFATYLGEDITGDSVDDILASVYVPGQLPFVLRLISGTDGTVVWERPQAADVVYWDFPVALGELTGDGKTDLVLGNFAVVEDPLLGEADAARFARVDGQTGHTISQTTRTFSTAGDNDLVQSILYVNGMEDVDQDATGEGLAGSMSVGYDEDPVTGELTPAEVVSSALVESGETAAALHQATRPELFSLSPAAELDGDGRTEAFEWGYPLEEGGDYLLTALRLIAPKILWARALNQDEAWHVGLAGEQDGAPGQEILTGRNDLLAGHWTSFVASLRGSNGSERWRISS
jgi:hypothetical protein